MSLSEDYAAAWKEYMAETSYAHPEELADELALTQVEHEVLDTWRWGEIFRVVYSKDDKFIAVTYRQSSGDENLAAYDMDVEVKDVQPKVVSKTVYE